MTLAEVLVRKKYLQWTRKLRTDDNRLTPETHVDCVTRFARSNANDLMENLGDASDNPRMPCLMSFPKNAKAGRESECLGAKSGLGINTQHLCRHVLYRIRLPSNKGHTCDKFFLGEIQGPQCIEVRRPSLLHHADIFVALLAPLNLKSWSGVKL